MSESLIKYGTSFQSKIITSLIVNNKFTKQIIDILELSYFDSDSNKWLVRTIRTYYFEYKSIPIKYISSGFSIICYYMHIH